MDGPLLHCNSPFWSDLIATQSSRTRCLFRFFFIPWHCCCRQGVLASPARRRNQRALGNSRFFLPCFNDAKPFLVTSGVENLV